MDNLTNLSRIMESYKNALMVKKGLTENTARAYITDIKMFCKYLNEKQLEYNTITALDADDYIIYLKQNFAFNTTIRKWNGLNSFYKYLCQTAEVMEKNPFKNAMPEQSKAEKNTEKKKEVLTKEEIDMLLKVIKREMKTTHSYKNPKRNYAIIKIMLNTGCRVNEVCGLTFENMDLDNQILTFPHTKNGKTLVVDINAATKKAIIEYLEERNDNIAQCDNVFITRYGLAMTDKYVNKMIDQYIQVAGINKHFTSHCFRHTYATEMYEATQDITAVQNALNHSHQNTTMRYVKGEVVNRVKTKFSL